jgi:hypothetical protein
MPLALQRILNPAPEQPEPEQLVIADTRPTANLAVVYTSIKATLAALSTAVELATRLKARITLLAPQVVPYPLPLASPPVLLDWNERRFRVIEQASRVETTVQIYLCRDRLQTLNSILKPGSVIVIGGSRRWWLNGDKRLARRLRAAGHEVIFTERK